MPTGWWLLVSRPDGIVPLSTYASYEDAAPGVTNELPGASGSGTVDVWTFGFGDL